MAQPGDPNMPETPDRDLFDHDDLVGFASPQSLVGRRREVVPESLPEPAVAAAPDLFDPPAPAPELPAWARETPPVPVAAEPAAPEAGLGLYAVYALILFAVPTFGASALLGLLAVARRAPPDDALAASHFVFQQRTLWIGAVAALAGAILVVVNLGVFVLFALALWLMARGAWGVFRLKAGRPVDNPRTWLI